MSILTTVFKDRRSGALAGTGVQGETAPFGRGSVAFSVYGYGGGEGSALIEVGNILLEELEDYGAAGLRVLGNLHVDLPEAGKARRQAGIGHIAGNEGD